MKVFKGNVFLIIFLIFGIGEFSHAQVAYQGGPLIKNAKVVMVLWGRDVSRVVKQNMPKFYSALMNGNYVDQLKQYSAPRYPLGRGIFAGEVTLIPDASLEGRSNITDSEIREELRRQIRHHKITSEPDTIFMIHFPPNVSITTDGVKSCESFCAYHKAFNLDQGFVAYAVIPDLGSTMCRFGCGSGSVLNLYTANASYGISASITDPSPTEFDSTEFTTTGWSTSNKDEVGNLCQSKTTSLDTPTQHFTVLQYWDNSANSCTVGQFTGEDRTLPVPADAPPPQRFKPRETQ